MPNQQNFMQAAINAAIEGMQNDKGGPFGAVVVKNGQIIAHASNSVTSDNDPTAHAEVNAIREACRQLGTFQLAGCDIYTSCEPCPMCLGAIYWARPDRVFYACNRQDAAKADFDDQLIYDEIALPLSQRKIPFIAMQKQEALNLFEQWRNKQNKIAY